jgi:hypothetical protein
LTIYEFKDGELTETGIVIPVEGQPCTLRVAY